MVTRHWRERCRSRRGGRERKVPEISGMDLAHMGRANPPPIAGLTHPGFVVFCSHGNKRVVYETTKITNDDKGRRRFP